MKDIKLVFLGIVWFLISIVLTFKLFPWMTAFSDTVVSVFSGLGLQVQFVYLLWWVGCILITLLSNFIIPIILVMHGFKEESIS